MPGRSPPSRGPSRSRSATWTAMGRRIDSPPGNFRRGETTRDGGVDLSDPVLVLSRLFLEAVPLLLPGRRRCRDNGSVEVTDAVLLLEYLRLDRTEPPPGGLRARSGRRWTSGMPGRLLTGESL